MPRLVSGEQQHFGRPIHPHYVASAQMCRGKHGRQFYFRCPFDPLSRDIEQRNRPHGDTPGPKSLRIGFPTLAQGSNDTGARDNDTG